MMVRTTTTKTVLAVAVLVLALCAVTTASASASTEPYIKVENSSHVVSTLASGQTRTVTATLSDAGEMHVTEIGLSLSCAKASGKGVVYNEYVGTEPRARLKEGVVSFEECGVVGAPECYVNGSIGGAGKITTNAIVARMGYQPKEPEDVEAILSPEEAGGTFASIKITECGLNGTYKIKGALVAGFSPVNTLLATTVQGVTAIKEVQEFKTIEFPVAKEELKGQELLYGAHPASIEGALEFTAPSGEELGVFN